MNKKSIFMKYLFLFWFGGSFYITLEVFYRMYSHYSMFLLAGTVFIIVDGLNEVWSWETGLIKQVLIGTIIALIGEFVTGCIVNLWLGLNIWDYSDLPFNLLGQICPQFALVWMPIILIAIILGDVIRWKFFNEETPRYKIGNKYFSF